MVNMSFDTHPICVHLYCSPQLMGLGVYLSPVVNETEGKKSQPVSQTGTAACPTWEV